MSATEEMIKKAMEQKVVLLPLLVPAGVYNFINELAAKRGCTPVAVLNEILFERLKAMAEENPPKEGG